jgi:hypothetical protein
MTKKRGCIVKYTRHCMKKKEKAKQQWGNESPYIHNPSFPPRDYTVTINPNPKP